MEIRSFASSSRGNCYLVSDGTTPLLLECGIRLRDIRQGTSFSLKSIAGVFVSHEHGDHAKATREIMRSGVDVYMSRGTAGVLGVSGHRVKIIEARKIFAIGTWKVLPFEAVHDSAEPLGFLLSSDAGKLLYLNDSAYCPYRFRGLTHLMVGCNHSIEILRQNVRSGGVPLAHKNRVLRNHMSLERLLELLKANDLSKVEEIHLLHLSRGNSNADEFKRVVEGATGKPTFIAEE